MECVKGSHINQRVFCSQVGNSSVQAVLSGIFLDECKGRPIQRSKAKANTASFRIPPAMCIPFDQTSPRAYTMHTNATTQSTRTLPTNKKQQTTRSVSTNALPTGGSRLAPVLVRVQAPHKAPQQAPPLFAAGKGCRLQLLWVAVLLKKVRSSPGGSHKFGKQQLLYVLLAAMTAGCL